MDGWMGGWVGGRVGSSGRAGTEDGAGEGEQADCWEPVPQEFVPLYHIEAKKSTDGDVVMLDFGCWMSDVATASNTR